jgi:predicted type IV restriction endonuclease
MSLETTLCDITARLRQGKFPNEQAISQGMVLRVFQELGWDTWDTNVVWPEFQTGEGRADFALCHPPSKPAVFTEVKQPGKAEEAVRQALEYAFHAGVPFVVLTDGRTWSFYLPAEQGSYEDRRVYKLDLYERPPAEAGEILHRYLERARVESGEALEAARNEYRSRNRRSQAKTAIPDAWRELVEKGDELLVEMLTSAVETKVGVRPDADDVADFLVALGKSVIFQAQRGSAIQPATAVSSRLIQTHTTSESDRSESSAGVAAPRIPPRTTSESARSGKLVILGKAYPYHNAKEALAIVLRELAKTDGTFLERCSRHPDAQGRTRRYIARTPEELYPDREDFRGMRESLPGGWFVATHMNNVLKKTIIRLAVEVAGLSFGKDVIVDL